MGVEAGSNTPQVWRKMGEMNRPVRFWRQVCKEEGTLAQRISGVRRRWEDGRWRGKGEEENVGRKWGDLNGEGGTRGEVVSWTKKPDGTIVALIKIGGEGIVAQLTDVDDEIKEGMEVEMMTRKLGEPEGKRGLVVYGYKFRPVMEKE